MQPYIPTDLPVLSCVQESLEDGFEDDIWFQGRAVPPWQFQVQTGRDLLFFHRQGGKAGG